MRTLQEGRRREKTNRTKGETEQNHETDWTEQIGTKETKGKWGRR